MTKPDSQILKDFVEEANGGIREAVKNGSVDGFPHKETTTRHIETHEIDTPNVDPDHDELAL